MSDHVMKIAGAVAKDSMTVAHIEQKMEEQKSLTTAHVEAQLRKPAPQSQGSTGTTQSSSGSENPRSGKES